MGPALPVAGSTSVPQGQAHSVPPLLRVHPLRVSLRSQVASLISIVDYHGRAVVLVKISCPEGPFFYEGAIYERSGSGTVMVSQGEHYRRIYRRFV